VMVMLPVTQIAIPANGKTSLDPNGYHIMLFRLKMRPAVGDKIEVTLKLDDGTTVPVEATVRK
jgi:periplasmic copper chaperone A